EDPSISTRCVMAGFYVVAGRGRGGWRIIGTSPTGDRHEPFHRRAGRRPPARRLRNAGRAGRGDPGKRRGNHAYRAQWRRHHRIPGGRTRARTARPACTGADLLPVRSQRRRCRRQRARRRVAGLLQAVRVELITPPGHGHGDGDGAAGAGLKKHLRPLLTTWLTGLLAVLPLVLTLVLLGWAVGIVNRFLGPSSLFGRSFTVFGTWFAAHPMAAWLLGTLLTLVLVYLLGLLVQSRLKGPFKALLDNTMRRIPLVGSVYALAE